MATLAKEYSNLGFDPDQIRAKYKAERDKRLRDDGNAQYVEVKDEFAHYIDDPYVEREERDPIEQDVEVVIIGGGFGGLLAGANSRWPNSVPGRGRRRTVQQGVRVRESPGLVR